MKTIISLLTGIALFNASQTFADSIYLYQEPIGAATPYSVPFSDWQYVGIRFETSQPAQITSLHTEAALLSSGSSSYFAALVRVPSVTSFPQGNPFAPGEVVHSTVFSLTGTMYAWAPLDIPFDVAVDPGAYAVVFGAGILGSSGPIDGILHVYQEVPGSTGFGWYYMDGWHENTAYSWDISVVGTPVPEPSTLALALLSLFVLAKRHKVA